jgi:transposase
MMDTLRFTVAGCGASEIASHFEVSCDVVYQWRRRALVVLESHMSEKLQAWLAEHGREFGLGYKGR